MDDDLYYFLKRIDKLYSLLEDKDTPEVDKLGIVNEIFLLDTWKYLQEKGLFFNEKR